MPTVECDSCRRRYQVDVNLVGKPVRCRQCGKAFIAVPYGMAPNRTSMEAKVRGQLPEDDGPRQSLDALLADDDGDASSLSADTEALDELFEAAESAPKPVASSVPNRYAYNNPLDIHAPEPRQTTAAPTGLQRGTGIRWRFWAVAGAAGVIGFALLIWAISAALSPSRPSSASGRNSPGASPADPTGKPGSVRPAGPTFILPPPPPGVSEFPVESLPTLSNAKLDGIVIDQLEHFVAIGPYMFRPPTGLTIRGRQDATAANQRWEVQTAGGGEINLADSPSVPARRLNVVVVPLAASRFKTPDEMLATPPARFRQGVVNGMPFVVTYDVRSLSRDRFSYVSDYTVFTPTHVVVFEAIAAEPFNQGVHGDLNLSVYTLRPLDVVVQALGDLAGDDKSEKAPAMRRLAAAPADSARRDAVVGAIVPALLDTDAGLRAAAVTAAGRWIADPARRVELLLPLLRDDDRATRDEAIAQVAAAGKDNPAAVKAISSVFEQSPGAVSRALKSIGPTAEPTVLDLLQKFSDSSALAGNLFDVLDSVATTRSTELMGTLARSEKRPVALRARRILKTLDSTFDPVREALLDLDAPAGPYVKEAVELLVGTTPTGRTDVVRRAVVAALWRVGFEGADDSAADRAADVLAVWATADLVPKLADVLNKQDAPAGPRRRAIIILTGIKDPRGAAAVRQWITQDNRLVVESLKQMGPVAEDEVIAMLRDRDPSVRRDACVILGVIGGEKSIPRIQPLLHDPRNPEISQAARAALDAIGARKPK